MFQNPTAFLQDGEASNHTPGPDVGFVFNRRSLDDAVGADEDMLADLERVVGQSAAMEPVRGAQHRVGGYEAVATDRDCHGVGLLLLLRLVLCVWRVTVVAYQVPSYTNMGLDNHPTAQDYVLRSIKLVTTGDFVSGICFNIFASDRFRATAAAGGGH